MHPTLRVVSGEAVTVPSLERQKVSSLHSAFAKYSTEPFVVSNNALFSRGCREELCVKSSSIKNHCRSAKHLQGKERLEKQQSREQDIADELLAYNKEVHPRGETLPPNQLVLRVKVVRTFLKAGVPLRKIELFRDLLAFRLTDRRFMMDLVPFVLKEAIKNEISGKDLGAIFDGTTRFSEAVVIVLRHVSDSWTLEQRLVRVQLLSKSLTGEELARELIHILSAHYTVGPDRLLAAMKDRASVNRVAMNTLQIIYPNVLDVGCFSHTLEHVGEHFETPTLSEFGTAWSMLFSHSNKAKLPWKADWQINGLILCYQMVTLGTVNQQQAEKDLAMTVTVMKGGQRSLTARLPM